MEKRKSFIISTAYYALIAALVYLGLKYAFAVIAPFIIGFGVAGILNPLVRQLTDKFHMKRRPTAIFVLLIFYVAIGALLGAIAVRSAVFLGGISERLPELYEKHLEPLIASSFDRIRELIAKFNGSSYDLSEGIAALFDYIKGSLTATVSNFSVKAIGGISAFAASIPEFMVELLFAVISSFFFILDFEKLIGILKSRLPKKSVEIIGGVKSCFFSTFSKYLRSYTLIMLITFSELFFGLSLIGVKNAFGIAFITSLLDILPILGTGAVLLPWAAFELVGGNFSLGIMLIVLWAVILVIRNIIEPKIVGRQVGLNPLVTLIAMFIGTRLFGFWGLFLAPICLSAGISVYRKQNQV